MDFEYFEYTSKYVSISYSDRKGHHTMEKSHFHDMYEIYYLINGERKYFIKNKTFHVKGGDLVLIRPMDLHKTLDADIVSHSRILVQFNKEYIYFHDEVKYNLLEENFSSNILRLDGNEKVEIEGMLMTILDECSRKADAFEYEIQAMVYQLLVKIYRLTRKRAKEDQTLNNSRISDIINYINSNYKQDLSLPSLSDKFFISTSHLSRLFKEATGFTFTEYINQVRVIEAQKLLRGTKMKVTRIVEEVGFGSVAQFGRTFKNITGQKPLEYRKNIVNM